MGEKGTSWESPDRARRWIPLFRLGLIAGPSGDLVSRRERSMLVELGTVLVWRIMSGPRHEHRVLCGLYCRAPT